MHSLNPSHAIKNQESRMNNFVILVSIVLFLGLNHAKNTKRGDFDYFLFTQDWPVSDCIDWLSKYNTTKCSIKGNKIFMLEIIFRSCMEPLISMLALLGKLFLIRRKKVSDPTVGHSGTLFFFSETINNWKLSLF